MPKPGTRNTRNNRKPRNQKPPPLRQRAKRPDASELTKRHNAIVSLKLSGSRRSEICEYVRVQWGLGEAQADRYIAEANALIAVEAAKAREENYNEQVAFRRMLRKRAMSADDARLALDVAKDEAKILDLYPAEKHQVEVEEKTLVSVDR